MSYKVEITAGSVTELAGKLLALAATMQTTPADPVMPEVKAVEIAYRIERVEPKAAKAKKGKAEEVAAETATGTGSIIETEAAAPQADETPTEAIPVSDPEPIAEATLDFDKDVAPVVLGAVKAKGREWVSSVLSQFGAERASQVPEEQFGELIAALQDGGPEA